MPADARELSRLLAMRARELTAELLPNGRRDGHEWRVGSLAGERGQSLGIHLSGSRAGVWCDFSSGERGDALDLVAAVLFTGDKRDAMDWARSWLGLGTPGAEPSQTRRPEPPAPADDPDDEAEAIRGAARRLFLAGQVRIAGTPAAAYLAGRGIDLAELGRQPRSLRFHPAVAHKDSGRTWPALLGAVTGPDGQIAGVHRTWLHQAEDGQWTKAPIRNAKMSLGRIKGGSIRLWRGASGKSLADAPPDDQVAIGEGIETCLSVVVAYPEIRVLSCVSLANMANISLPATIRVVTLLKDEDGNNAQAERGFRRAVDRFHSEGRKVLIARPPVGKDFNDTLQAEGGV